MRHAAACTLPLALVLTAACAGGRAAQVTLQCDSDNGGITLPDGFCAVVVADNLPQPRHLAVRPDGDVFVATYGGRGGTPPGGVVVLRDTTGDGRADVRARFGPDGGSGIALQGDDVYFGMDREVRRYRVPAGDLQPADTGVVIVRGLPARPGHRAKSLALRDGDLFVNIGSPSNSCQVRDRTDGSPGQDPCPELETRAGIWRFDARRPGQTEADGQHWATGMRNTVALAFDSAGQLFGVIHGRDQLAQNWSRFYTVEQGAELPAEEFVRIGRGSDYGWPYCYYDWQTKRNVLAPEYGGDGKKVGRCTDKDLPLVGFPGHWAPDGLLFYDGTQFPASFRGGAFIAFHGSWNRAPMPQQGYKVVFVPFREGRPTGTGTTFASGFAGPDVSPNGARHRPVGLAVGPDGSLYISDDTGGRVWRVMYRPARR
ncbi:MAG: PQQ-dependent sugar dehydrogenase [Gemmatimonadota bacterium]|jgi:glucose/arabinose dehydrogenase